MAHPLTVSRPELKTSLIQMPIDSLILEIASISRRILIHIFKEEVILILEISR